MGKPTRAIRLAIRLLRIAAIEQRVELLAHKYPSVPLDSIQEMAQVDPTGDKGSYLEWVVNRTHRGNIRWPEDRNRVKQALETYNSLKRSPRLLKENQVSPDINKYTLHDLETIHDKVHRVDLRTQRQVHEEAKEAGTKIIYNQGEWKILQIGGPGVDPEQASQAACIYARGTNWCTSDTDVNKRYLEQGPLYIIFKDGERIAQTDGQQVMDVRDVPLRFRDNIDIYKVLMDIGIISKATFGYDYAVTIGRRVPEYEPAIMKDPMNAIEYAVDVIDGRWPEAEPYIMTQPDASYFYATLVLRSRWPQAESVISTDATAAFMYAKNVLHSRWPQAEPTIMKDLGKAVMYVDELIKDRWPEAERYLRQSSLWWYQYISVLKEHKADLP